MNELMNTSTPLRKNRRDGSGSRLPLAPLTLEGMRRAVAELLGEPTDSIGYEDDLIQRGVDSVGIMRLANTWRRSGIELKFAELIERPFLREWWMLASSRQAAQPWSREEVAV